VPSHPQALMGEPRQVQYNRTLWESKTGILDRCNAMESQDFQILYFTAGPAQVLFTEAGKLL